MIETPRKLMMWEERHEGFRRGRLRCWHVKDVVPVVKRRDVKAGRNIPIGRVDGQQILARRAGRRLERDTKDNARLRAIVG